MLLPVVGVIAGLALLTYAADQFVAGAARVSSALRLSPVLIGAIIIGFGTSLPEMIVSALAAGQGNLDIAVGNIVGSNIANLTLVLGAAALVVPVVVGSPTIRREAPLSLSATLIFAVLVQDGLTRVEAVASFALLALALGYIIRSARRDDEEEELTAEVDDLLTHGPIRLRSEWLRTGLGLMGTLVAAQMLVLSATDIADGLGLADGFVGLTVVAIGTSLPELATALQAARRRDTDLIVGNLLGSNLFNSLAVAGAAGLSGPGTVADAKLTGLAVALMLGVALAATGAMATGRRVVRFEGATLLILWLAALPFLA